MNRLLRKFTFSPEIVDVIESCKGIFIPTTKQELYDMVFGTGRSGKYDVVYDVPGQGVITEATVVRAKNGVVVNYVEDYMRRRDRTACVLATINRPISHVFPTCTASRLRT